MSVTMSGVYQCRKCLVMGTPDSPYPACACNRPLRHVANPTMAVRCERCGVSYLGEPPCPECDHPLVMPMAQPENVWRCCVCGLVGLGWAFPLCMCFGAHEKVARLPGCTCNQCVVGRNMRIVRCAGASVAAGNGEMA